MFSSVVKRDKEVLKLIASIASLIRSASSVNYELICSVVADVCKRSSDYLSIHSHSHSYTHTLTHILAHTHMSLVRLFVYIDSHSKHFERSPCAQLANWFPCSLTHSLTHPLTTHYTPTRIHSFSHSFYSPFNIQHSIDIKSMEKTYLAVRCGKRWELSHFQFSIYKNIFHFHISPF